MKKMMILAAAVMALATISCEKYDDGRPQQTVRQSFNEACPGAFDLEWEWEGTYWEVSYETGTRPNGTEHEAWFDKDGNWIRTKTEVLISAVPQEIKNALAADPTYSGATFSDNDADYIKTPTGNSYRFDLNLDGREVKVEVSEDGTVSPASFGWN